MALTRATDKIIANADGNLNLSGIVTASSFKGDGSGLTGVVQSDTPLGNSTASTIFYEADNTTTISTTTTFQEHQVILVKYIRSSKRSLLEQHQAQLNL